MESSSQTIDKVKLEQIDKENDCLPENYIF